MIFAPDWHGWSISPFYFLIYKVQVLYICIIHVSFLVGLHCFDWKMRLRDHGRHLSLHSTAICIFHIHQFMKCITMYTVICSRLLCRQVQVCPGWVPRDLSSSSLGLFWEDLLTQQTTPASTISLPFCLSLFIIVESLTVMIVPTNASPFKKMEMIHFTACGSIPLFDRTGVI